MKTYKFEIIVTYCHKQIGFGSFTRMFHGTEATAIYDFISMLNLKCGNIEITMTEIKT
jgi:hypothetical protein